MMIETLSSSKSQKDGLNDLIGANTEGNEGEGTANSEVLVLDYKPREMIADELYDNISNKYPGRSVKIQVAEDGENGCDIEYKYE